MTKAVDLTFMTCILWESYPDVQNIRSITEISEAGKDGTAMLPAQAFENIFRTNKSLLGHSAYFSCR